MITFISNSPETTAKFGERLAKKLKPGDILCLTGDLGTGKTTFVKGLAKGLKVDQAKVSSPTFVVMNCYDGKLPLYHFDLYRLEDIKEMGAIGYDEFLYGEGIAVIEWAERLKELMPKEYLQIQLEHQGPNERVIKLNAIGKRYETLIN